MHGLAEPQQRRGELAGAGRAVVAGPDRDDAPDEREGRARERISKRLHLRVHIKANAHCHAAAHDRKVAHLDSRLVAQHAYEGELERVEADLEAQQ